MSRIVQVEEESRGKPIFCLFGDEPIIQEGLIKAYAEKFRLIVISDSKPDYLDDYPDVYFITYKDSILLPNLQETIDYAVCFVSCEKTLKHLSPVMQKLGGDATQTVLGIKVFFLSKCLSEIDNYKKFPTVKIAAVGELMTRKKIEPEGVLSNIIENAILNKAVKVTDDGATSVFPLGVPDSIMGISRLLFGSFKNNAVYELFYKTPQTITDLTRAISRVEEVTITFSDKTSPTHSLSRQELEQIVESRLRLNLKPLDSSFAGFESELLLLFESKEPEPTLTRKRKKMSHKKAGPVKRSIGFFISSITFGIIVFLVINLSFFGLGVWYMKQAIAGLETGNFTQVASDARKARFLLTTVRPTATLAFDVATSLNIPLNLHSNFILLERVVDLSEIAGSSINKLLQGERLTSQDISSAFSNFTFLYRETQRLSATTENRKLAQNLKHTYSKFLSFSEVLPTILGFGIEKNYLLLFQNNEELRPTGGFIGSIGDLTMQDGVVKTLTIQDVYELDGQLKNHVEPPFVVRRYLQPHLYLRDSNFYPDFQETASKAAYIYNLETSKRPDAVIAVNLEVLKRILGVTGPLNLTQHNITVNEANISDFIHSTIQDDKFAGSTQKKDILNKVLNMLIEKVTTDKSLSVKLVELLPDLLEEKHLLFSFSDSSIQKVFSANNYSGEIRDSRIEDKKKINDFIAVFEANIGVNKVNKSITRSISYQAMIADKTLSSKATLLLKNSSNKDGYKAYITIMAPAGSKLREIKIDNVAQATISAVTDFSIYEASDFTKPQGLEVEQYTKNQVTYFSFIHELAPQGEDNIEIRYLNGSGKELLTTPVYSLLHIKQPGTLSYPFTLTIDYPEDYKPIDTSASSYGKNFMQDKREASTDFLTEIKLQRTDLQR